MKESFSLLEHLFFAGAIALFVSFPLMLLWNWLMPYLFNFPDIDFLQSLGMYVLSKILFQKGKKNT